MPNAQQERRFRVAFFLGDAKKGGESNLDNFLVNQTIQSQFRLK